MSHAHQIVPVPVALPMHRPRKLLTVGAGAGAIENIDAHKQLRDALPGEFGEQLYVDAVGSHAERVAREAGARGVPARGVTASTKELERLPLDVDGVVVQLDRPEAQLAAFEFAVSRNVPIVLYALVAPPRGLPIGLMGAFTTDELNSPAADDLRTLLGTLAPITSRRGSASITEGDEVADARVADIRRVFRAHLFGVMRKVVADLTPEVAPITATDGERTAPVVVLSSDKWSSPIELERRVILERRDLVIEPGSRLMAAETLTGAEPELRLHDLTFRRSDRRLGSRGSRTLAAADFAPLPPPPPASTTGSRMSARDRDDGAVVDALVGLAVLALLFGAFGRLQPGRVTD